MEIQIAKRILVCEGSGTMEFWPEVAGREMVQIKRQAGGEVEFGVVLRRRGLSLELRFGCSSQVLVVFPKAFPKA